MIRWDDVIEELEHVPHGEEELHRAREQREKEIERCFFGTPFTDDSESPGATYQKVELPTASLKVSRASCMSCCTDSLTRQAGRHRLHGDSCLEFSMVVSSGGVLFFTSGPGLGSFGRRTL